MTFVLILDSNIDKHILATGEDAKHNLVGLIKSQGTEASESLKSKILNKYQLTTPSKILKHNNFILIEEKVRVRVFLIEDV